MTTPTKGCSVSLTKRVSNGLAGLGKAHGFSIEINSTSKVRVAPEALGQRVGHFFFVESPAHGQEPIVLAVTDGPRQQISQRASVVCHDSLVDLNLVGVAEGEVVGLDRTARPFASQDASVTTHDSALFVVVP